MCASPEWPWIERERKAKEENWIKWFLRAPLTGRHTETTAHVRLESQSKRNRKIEHAVHRNNTAMVQYSHALMSTRLRALALYKDLLRLAKDYPDPA